MSQKRTILFIINPISGINKKSDLPALIKSHLDSKKFEPSIMYTEYAGHGKKISAENHHKFNVIVAVGGDGTINEIASQLTNTNCSLAIIPSGSGNGLARDLHIPMNTKKAIKQLNTATFNKIDTCYLNDLPFFCTAGIGFDADVAHIFNNSPSRGLKTLSLIHI